MQKTAITDMKVTNDIQQKQLYQELYSFSK